MFVRVICCEVLGTLEVPVKPPCDTVAAMSADWSYLSWPMPAARPKTMKLLLATRRHAEVFTVSLLTFSLFPPDVPTMFVSGRSRSIHVTETAGTTTDSDRTPTRAPQPNCQLF